MGPVNGGAAAVVLPGGKTAHVRVGADVSTGESSELGVRPEHLTLVDPQNETAAFTGQVAIVERLGNATMLYIDTPAGQLIVEGDGNLVIKSGDPVGLALNERHAHLFGPGGATL